MNILADRHHADLTWSLILLAKRLGANIYFPIGMEWYDEGYYRLYGDLKKKDPERWIAKKYLVDTYYNVKDDVIITADTVEKYEGCRDYPRLDVLTLEKAKNTQIDVVICSVNENEPYFAKLKEFYPNAKFIRQTGNDVDDHIDSDLYPNLLASARIPYDLFTKNKVLYRQEFSRLLFKPQQPYSYDHIISFQNDIEQFEDTWDVWLRLKHELSDYKFWSFGAGCESGRIYSKSLLISWMADATFLLQSKGPWEGYGHIIHNAMAIGRPMIVKMSDYQGKLAEPLLIKDETYLEMTDPDLLDKIKFYSQPDRYKKMSIKCQQVFEENVNFDKEFVEIQRFFKELQ